MSDHFDGGGLEALGPWLYEVFVVQALPGVGQTIINIAGGVPAFIDEVTRSRRTDG